MLGFSYRLSRISPDIEILALEKLIEWKNEIGAVTPFSISEVWISRSVLRIYALSVYDGSVHTIPSPIAFALFLHTASSYDGGLCEMIHRSMPTILACGHWF